MRTATRICLLISIAMLCCRCGDGPASGALSEAAAVMEGNHERAYSILDSLDKARLDGEPGSSSLSRKETARFSMLMSMALDKKYVDLTSDSLIAPAVRYYAHHGSPDEKLKTAFYHARIMENAGRPDDALETILKGERLVRKAEDHLFIGRYYMKKSQLYSDKFEWEKALRAALDGERHCRLVNDYRGWTTALLACSSNFKVLHVNDSAYIYLSRIKPIWEKIDDFRKGEYYRQLMTYSMLDERSDTDNIYTECLASGISPSNLPYIAFTDYHISRGEPDLALDNLRLSTSYGQIAVGSKEYENRRFKIDAVAGKYQEAYESMRRYYERIEEYEYGILTSDARVLEERIDSERKETTFKYKLLATILGLGLVTIIAAVIISRLRKRQKLLAQAVHEAKEEKRELEEFISSGSVVSEEMAMLLSKRIRALNDVIISTMSRGQLLSKNPKAVLDSLSEDRDGFILSVAMEYSLSHPEFVRQLRKYDLTTWEIGFCCLYMMGLSGKEISGHVLSSSNIYNISGRIRQKIGLSLHDANLPIYLKNLFQQHK